MSGLYLQHNTLTPAIDLKGSSECTFFDCKVAHTGASGVWMETYEEIHAPPEQNVYIESSFNVLDHCELFDLNGHGVMIGDQHARLDDWATTGDPNKAEPNVSNSVLDCYIHHFGGPMYKDAVGIYIGHSRSAAIEHNEIVAGNWAGISAGTFMGHNSTGVPCGEPWPLNNQALWIASNNIWNTNLRLTDGAGIYSMGTQGAYNGIRSTLYANYIHDIVLNPYYNTRVIPQGCEDHSSPQPNIKGIQFDTGSSDWDIQANFVARCARMVQFNSHHNAMSPEDVLPNLGLAVWPVPVSYECSTGLMCQNCSQGYTLSGMFWDSALPNTWDRPSDALVAQAGWAGNPWEPWDQCWGYAAVPTMNGENVQITGWDADPGSPAAMVAADAGPQTPFGNWLAGVKRIYWNYPVVIPCVGDGTVALPVPEDQF